jgi:hypothetical protein
MAPVSEELTGVGGGISQGPLGGLSPQFFHRILGPVLLTVRNNDSRYWMSAWLALRFVVGVASGLAVSGVKVGDFCAKAFVGRNSFRPEVDRVLRKSALSIQR